MPTEPGPKLNFRVGTIRGSATGGTEKCRRRMRAYRNRLVHRRELMDEGSWHLIPAQRSLYFSACLEPVRLTQLAQTSPDKRGRMYGGRSMTCNEIDDLISSRSSLSGLPPLAAEHLAGCERCRNLVRVLQEDSSRHAPSQRGLGQIKAAVLGDLEPVKPLAPAFGFLVAFGFIFLAVTAVGSFQLRAFGWGVLNIPQRVVVFGSLAAGMGLLASSMVRQMFPGSKHLVSPGWLPVGVLVFLTLEAAALFQPRVELAFVSNGLGCLRAGLSYAIPGALLLWLVLRHGAILSPKLTAATAGGFAGLIGLTVLEVHCPILNRYHILIWHMGVVLLSMLGGLSLGAAWERIGTWRKDGFS